MSESLGRILVVDDEQPIVEVLSEYFEGKGYTVATAPNGEQALSTVREFRPAVVLLDVRMPGIDGVEVLRRIRAFDKSVAVIMVTGNEDVALARQTLSIGAFEFVAKPFDFAHLDRAVTLGLIQSGGGPAAESGTRGAEAGEGPARTWRELALAAFRAARSMTTSGRDSTGQRLESAALAAARAGVAGRAAPANELLNELDTVLTVAADLGDITPALRESVQAAIAVARTSLPAAD
jgi:DNA-binding response OmpR family regulator